MKVLSSITEMHDWVKTTQSQTSTIGFVPTMGCLHEGHCALLRTARQQCDKLVLSIFVNPTQFGPNEDFGRYPRTFDTDIKRAESCGVDMVFAPDTEEMYPATDHPEPIEEQVRSWFDTLTINTPSLCNNLCGAFRPGHFQGVATVVAKLFNIVQPHTAYFGEKDYQQLQIIRRMVTDLGLSVEIVACPTVRERDGLAMSSRNTYLSKTDRKRALALYQALTAAQKIASDGHTTPSSLIQTATTIVSSATDRVDYISLCNATTLAPLQEWNTPSVLAMAAWIGPTRLIDNVIFP